MAPFDKQSKDNPVIVKVQLPFEAAHPLYVYDKTRAFTAMSGQQDAPELVAFLRKQAAPKAYVVAERGTQDGRDGVFLRCDVNLAETQPW